MIEERMEYSFFVPGVPVPKGSTRAFLHKKAHKVITVQDNRDKQKPWASMIGLMALQAGIKYPRTGPVEIALAFYMPRPKGHYGSGHNSELLKTSSPQHHTVKPDLDKLFRCVKDALTGIAWVDDSQVCDFGCSAKMYINSKAEPTGVRVNIKFIDERGNHNATT